jgi:hypothetical protein
MIRSGDFDSSAPLIETDITERYVSAVERFMLTARAALGIDDA